MKYSLSVGTCHGFLRSISKGLGNIGNSADQIKNEVGNGINQGVSEATGTVDEIGSRC